MALKDASKQPKLFSSQPTLVTPLARYYPASSTVSPIAIDPNATIRDANYLNHLIQSQTNYSLVLTSDAAPRPNWILDSGASFSCTWDMTDLTRPSQLKTPILIGQADGATLQATHVGFSALSPCLEVYFVPHSAVKFLSLGALLRLGYSYAPGADLSITITDPSNNVLCTFPMQTNIIWFFPINSCIHHLPHQPPQKPLPPDFQALPDIRFKFHSILPTSAKKSQTSSPDLHPSPLPLSSQ